LLVNATAVVASLLLLKYYYAAKYRLVFFTGVFSTACNIGYALVFYTILEFHRLGSFHLPLLILSVAAPIPYAVGLVFLRSKDKRATLSSVQPALTRWLRSAGGLTLIIAFVLLFRVIEGSTNPSFARQNTLNTILLWASFADFLIPVLFMLHFLSELRKPMPARREVNNITKTAGIALVALTMVFDLLLAAGCYTSIHASDWGYQETKELAQLSDVGVFENSKGTLYYRLLKPLDYDPHKKYPIVVSLPYGGEPATDTIRQIQGAVAAELLTGGDNRRKYPAFIFIPSRSRGTSWGGLPYYTPVDSLVFDALIALDKQFSIDEKRRYVTGLSLGGFGTWNFICKRPDLFAAGIPVAGGGDPRLASKIVNVAVWAFHGAEDKNIPVIRSREMIDAIKSAGGHPKYTEFPHEEHNIWNLVSATPGLLDWLFDQRRK
jgi:hypothetical protein